MLKRLDLSTRIATVVGVILTLVLVAGCAVGPDGAPDLPVEDSAYKLGPGDRVSVTVFGQEDLTGEYVVDGAGNISMALIGAIPAGGASAPVLEEQIADRLTPKYLNDPKVSVQVLNYRPIYIVGEVKNPGSYAYVDDMVVMNAVAMAGGLTYRAVDDQFYITRQVDPERMQREAGPNTLVQPGDLITVRERFF